MDTVADVNAVVDEYGLEGSYGRRKDSLKTLENDVERSKKERIIYDKDFLLECFFLPCSRQKPNDFPLPNLGCTLGSIKFTGNSPFATAPPYVPPKRKEENGRRDRDRDSDDNISLRPHSGNFSGGCGPSNNSNSPLASRDRDGMNAGLQMILDEHFRDHARNNSLRFAPNKRFELPNDRVRNDRERGERDFKDGRDARDRNSRTERNQFTQRRPGNPQAAWGTDVPERESDWNRRRNRNGSGGGGTYRDAKDKKGFFDGKDRGYYRDRGGGGDREEEEPEWFSGGPTSQHDTIELRGFMDDDRRDNKPLEHAPSGDNAQSSSSNGSVKTSDVTQEANEGYEENSNMDMNLEKILKMVHIPHLLPTGLLEDEEPSGTSRFSGIFQKNSEISIPKDEKPSTKKSALDALIEARIAPRAATNSTDETEGKKEITEELGNALRSMLLNPSRSFPAEKRQPLPMEFIAREAPPKKTDEKESNSGVNVLQLLLDKMIDPKNKTVSGRSSVNSEEPSSVGPPPGLNTPRRTSHPTEVTAMALNQLLEQNSQGQGPQRPPQYHSQSSQDIEHAFNIPMNCNVRPPMPQQMPPSGQVNPLQIFETLIRQQHPPNAPREVLNGHQIMQMLPPEIQFFVQHSNPAEDFWTQSDSRALIAALTTGEFTFRKVLQDLVAPHCVRKPFLASLVQMIVTGTILVPSLTLVGPPIKFVKPEHQTHMAQKQHYNHHESSSRNNDECALDMRRRSGTPVSTMAFTPTSVMRKMTAEPPKPSSHPINSNSQAVHPGPQHSSNNSAHPPQDFSFIVSQLTGQPNRPPHGPPQHGLPQHGPPQHGPPQHGPPQMHPAHFQPIQPHGQVMGLPPAGMFMHPGYRMVPPPQVMSIPHSHREMPQS